MNAVLYKIAEVCLEIVGDSVLIPGQKSSNIC